jgi:hypothetical protein
MILQLEDCVGFLKTLYPAMDFIFLFDHSSGHAKKRIGRLDASAMNKGFGGTQPSMRETIIKTEDGYLGPFPRVVTVGDALRFDFQESDNGPFWLSEQEKLRQKFDRIVGRERQVEKTNADLAQELSKGQIHVIDPRKYKLVRLQEMARERNIDLKRNETSKKEGWVGKQKGFVSHCSGIVTFMSSVLMMSPRDSWVIVIDQSTILSHNMVTGVSGAWIGPW